MHSMARSAAWFFDVSPSSHRGLDNLIRRAEAWKRFLYGEIQPVIYIHPITMKNIRIQQIMSHPCHLKILNHPNKFIPSPAQHSTSIVLLLHLHFHSPPNALPFHHPSLHPKNTTTQHSKIQVPRLAWLSRSKSSSICRDRWSRGGWISEGGRERRCAVPVVEVEVVGLRLLARLRRSEGQVPPELCFLLFPFLPRTIHLKPISI